MKEFVLVVQVLGLEQLDRTMGPTVTDSALTDLALHVTRLTSEALSLAYISAPAQPLRRGCWGAPFALRNGSPTGSQMGESIDSISAAAQELANDAALQVFGASSAVMASLAAACIASSSSRNLEQLDQEVRSKARASLDTQSQAALWEILSQRTLRTMFQPIVSLPAGSVVGFEALTRGPVGSDYESADQLFGAAARSGLTQQLEMACAMQALTFLDRLPEPLWMTVNASPNTAAELYKLLSANETLCRGLTIELTEHLPLGKIDALRSTLDGFRTKGARIALDDTGCGYADLDTAASIKAEIVKLCITVIGRLEQHRHVRDSVAEAVEQAHALGALVLAEGVETTAQAEMLSDIGIDLAQGWLYGKPFPSDDLHAYKSALSGAIAASH
jgi:EAL domain-containing protein (putative c-di-GMP-specific phosphodiesterase class I)